MSFFVGRFISGLYLGARFGTRKEVQPIAMISVGSQFERHPIS